MWSDLPEIRHQVLCSEIPSSESRYRQSCIPLPKPHPLGGVFPCLFLGKRFLEPQSQKECLKWGSTCGSRQFPSGNRGLQLLEAPGLCLHLPEAPGIPPLVPMSLSSLLRMASSSLHLMGGHLKFGSSLKIRYSHLRVLGSVCKCPFPNCLTLQGTLLQ